MTTLYVTQDRAFIRKKGRTLLVQSPHAEAVRLPLERVTEVVLCGDISLSGAVLRELAEDGIGLGMVGPRGEWVGRWEARESKAILLRRAQFRAADDAALTLAVARGIVAGKLRNQRALLLRARREGAPVAPEVPAELDRLRAAAWEAASLDALRGVEGDGAARYFPAYGAVVSVHGFAFRTRVRRPPDSPINAMLSFGYALLANAAATAVRTVGFDAHLGFLHADRYGRESLALDLMEEFRPVVVDALVAALVRRRMVAPGEFETSATECHLSAGARRVFVTQFERKLESEVQHPVLARPVSHRRAIELQARLLAKVLLGEAPAYVPFSKR